MQCHGMTLIDLGIVTLTFKILSGQCLGSRKVKEIDTWLVILVWRFRDALPLI